MAVTSTGRDTATSNADPAPATVVSTGKALAFKYSFKGTPVFMSPEVVINQNYSRKSDVWGVGCTLIQMATGNPPYSEFSNHFAALFAIADLDAKPPEVSRPSTHGRMHAISTHGRMHAILLPRTTSTQSLHRCAIHPHTEHASIFGGFMRPGPGEWMHFW